MAEENIGLPSEHMIEGVELLMRKHKRGDDRYRCAKMFGFTALKALEMYKNISPWPLQA